MAARGASDERIAALDAMAKCSLGAERLFASPRTWRRQRATARIVFAPSPHLLA
jgi:hypothetical protein